MNTVRRTRFLSAFVLVAVLITLLVPSFSIEASAADADGFIPSFSKRIKYTTEKVISTLPKTYEATVKVEKNYSSAYPIFSSFLDSSSPSFSFGVNSDGRPFISVMDDSLVNHTVTFDEIDLRTGEWVNIAATLDTDASRALCYVNGELKSTKESTLPLNYEFAYPTIVGGNYRDKGFFDGAILEAAAFSSFRSESEIKSDFTDKPSGDELLFYYDFSSFDNAAPIETVADLSAKKNNLSLLREFYDEPTVPLEKYAYSFALIGDIQMINYHHPENLHYIYDWLIENKDEKKIAFAFNLGDITDKNTPEEWENGKKEIHKLDGVIPYSIVRGNHDRTIANYKAAFNYEDYKDTVVSFDGTMLNSYQTLEVEGNKYLILNLDYKMSDGLLKWAHSVVEKYHDYNVIVTSHMYLSNNGKPLDSENSLSPKVFGSICNSDELWDNFISKHENIMLVISGHISCHTILTTQRVGDNGNTVTQILVDPQGLDKDFIDEGGLGMVAMLYFSKDGKTVQTQFYSTIQDKYYLTQNEYTISLDPIQSSASRQPKNHTYTPKYDSENHWQECDCGDKIKIREHKLSYTVLVEATEDKQGIRRMECDCGYKASEKFDYETVLKEERRERITVIAISLGAAALVAGAAAASVVIIKKKKKKDTDF